MISPAKFTREAQAKGIYVPGLGPRAITTLATLVQAPAPVIAKEYHWEKSAKPVALPHVSRLIEHGYAQLIEGFYHATNEGRKWLGKIIDSGILTS